MDEILAIERLKTGDIRGLQTLVESYQVEAVRDANLITGDRTTAEDIVQNACLRVYKKIDQWTQDGVTYLISAHFLNLDRDVLLQVAASISEP